MIQCKPWRPEFNGKAIHVGGGSFLHVSFHFTHIQLQRSHIIQTMTASLKEPPKEYVKLLRYVTTEFRKKSACIYLYLLSAEHQISSKSRRLIYCFRHIYAYFALETLESVLLVARSYKGDKNVNSQRHDLRI